MAVRFDQNPQTNDTILLEIETIVNGKVENPFKITRVIVYYMNVKQCDTPTQSLKTSSSTFYFNEAEPLLIIGNRDIAAWMPKTDSIIKQAQDTECGKFQFEWKNDGLREGTYILFWEWVTNGTIHHSHKTFYVKSKEQFLTANPMRYTPKDKYKILMNRYTPGMYRAKIKNSDITPEIISALNASIGEGFTLLEDLAVQVGDMLDANLAHKSILPLLANMFGLKLRTDEVNRWREQIKRAVQLHKRKGTLNGLYEALSQAGIRLVKLTKLWQVKSVYVQTDAFVVTEEMKLSTVIGSLSHSNVSIKEIKVKSNNGEEFLNVPMNCVMVSPPLEPTDTPILVWTGNVLLDNPIHIFVNDVLLVKYEIKNIPEKQKPVEDYIRSLPLADDRPDSTPTKNWNIRLIEDDDPLFDLVIPTRYPFSQATVYGKIRTRFLYSEQVYNMDTYNGSLRDSLSPCDMDHTFQDQCTACQSSRFNVDLEIENLSDERVKEAKEIIKEYSPFHARLHYINITGAVNEFMLLPQENIECLVQAGVPQPLTKIKQAEGIAYEIEWRDGSKERNIVQ